MFNLKKGFAAIPPHPEGMGFPCRDNMKFNLKKLFRREESLSHIFLTCVTDEIINKIKSKDNYDVDTTEVDMKLYIEDTEVDIKKFFDGFMNRYEEHLKTKAEELLKEKLSKKVDDISWTLDQLKTKLEYLEDNISWEENLLK